MSFASRWSRAQTTPPGTRAPVPALNPSNEAYLQDSCTCKGTDPFRTNDRVPAGPFKGQCFSSCTAKSLRVLNKVEAAPFKPAPGEITVANVTHQGRLWVAVLNVLGVEDVVAHVEHFPAIVPAAHAELRFKFGKDYPVRLVPQLLEDRRRIKPTRLYDLVFSVEANTPFNEPGFNLVTAWQERYGLSFRLVSLDTKYDFMVARQKHVVEQWKLKLTPEQRAKTLRLALFYGTQAGAKQMYHLLARSCVTEMFRVLDAAINYRGSRWVVKTALDFMRHLPTLIPQALETRGLLLPNDESKMISLGEEYDAILKTKTAPALPTPAP